MYNKDKNKGKLQTFVSFTKKINDNFSDLNFLKRPYNIFFLTVKVAKHIEYMRQKLNKNILIVKFHPRMKCLHVFSLFSSRYQILFLSF